MPTSTPKGIGFARNQEPWLAAVARLLLVVFGGMLLIPLLPASTLETSLVICCKRSGKHLCAAPISSSSTVSLPGGAGVSEKCPYQIRHSLGTVTTFGLTPGSSADASAGRGVAERAWIPRPFSAPWPQANLKRGPPLRSVHLLA
jgi:hypothetical protein